MLTTQHSPKDDRIFYKEGLSLKKAGYDVTIICTADERGFVRDMGENILNPDGNPHFQIDGITIICIKKSKCIIQKLVNKVNLSRYFAEFVSQGIKLKADIYHAHEPQSAYIAIKIQNKTNAKIIYDAHEPWLSSPRKDWIIRKLILNKLKYVITANQITRDDLLSHNHQLQTEVIYNCAQQDIFKPHFDEKKLDNIIIVHEGHLLFDRGLKDIIEVIKLLKNDDTNIKFRIVGETYGKEKQYLNRKILEYGLRDNIEETGWIDYEKVHVHLKDCSIGLIINTLVETNTLSGPPNKFFNYLTYGIAIVAVNLPETTRLLNITQSGITIQDRSVENIYRAIKELIDNKELLKKYCENSFKAAEMYNWKNEERKLLRFYENID